MIMRRIQAEIGVRERFSPYYGALVILHSCILSDGEYVVLGYVGKELHYFGTPQRTLAEAKLNVKILIREDYK